MKPRERVIRALNFQEIDSPVRDFGTTGATSITSQAYQSLAQYLGYNDLPILIKDYWQGLVRPSEEIRQYLNADFREINPLPKSLPLKDGVWTDGWGVHRKKAEPHDYYDQVKPYPLEDATIDEIEALVWPDPDQIPGLDEMEKTAKDLYENSPYAVIGDTVSPGLLGNSLRMRGYENFFMDMLSDEEFTKAFLGRLTENYKRTFVNYLERVGKYLNVVCFHDDYGMQDRLMVSPEVFREVLKPFLKDLFATIKSKTDAKLFLHTCGSVYPIVDDLIEIGVDILNPVQPQARDMDPFRLKQEFAGRIVLWGGIDTQGYLRTETPEVVEKNIRHVCKEMALSGGYVLAPSHNIQSDIPPENIVCMYRS